DNEPPGASFLDIMVLNWLELRYVAPATAVNDRLRFQQAQAAPVTLSGFSDQPRIFDISQPDAPTQLTGWMYEDGLVQLTPPAGEIIAVGSRGFVPPAAIVPLRQSDWHNAQNQADLLIITTDELAPALAPLVEARENQGLATTIVPVAEIYDEFGYGAASPESIHDFIIYAVQNWQKPPTYLFLVGDATTDYYNYEGNAPVNQVPSLLVPVEFSGETVSDSRLADVDGDMKPDLAIGRWPVDTVADVENLVTRTLAYEGGTAVNQALFAADGTEAQFATIANQLGSESGLSPDQMTVLAGPQASDVVAAWNKGAWLTTYVGHGSVERWGKEDLFFPAAVANLDAATPPIVLQLTCLSGLFAHPELQSLSETMLLDNHGPVLLIGATSLTFSTNQEQFASSLLQALQEPANRRIGDAFQQAKQSLNIAHNDGLREVSDTFVLFGDPSALVIRP
ncbi:MAG: C25 family cysteine peptidase, partial [Anaerolineae bacterium]